MSAFYAEFWQHLRSVDRLEKQAAEAPSDYIFAGEQRLASQCAAIFDFVLEKSASISLPRKYANLAEGTRAFQAAGFVAECAKDHARAGEKISSAMDDSLLKLATAFYLDEVLATASASMSDGEKNATARLRLLGREYAVDLMREIVG